MSLDHETWKLWPSWLCHMENDDEFLNIAESSVSKKGDLPLMVMLMGEW